LVRAIEDQAFRTEFLERWTGNFNPQLDAIAVDRLVWQHARVRALETDEHECVLKVTPSLSSVSALS
jgi:hypothetical protein